jgi:hypothetical protein
MGMRFCFQASSKVPARSLRGDQWLAMAPNPIGG